MHWQAVGETRQLAVASRTVSMAAALSLRQLHRVPPARKPLNFIHLSALLLVTAGNCAVERGKHDTNLMQ